MSDELLALGIGGLAIILALAGIVLPSGGGGMVIHDNEWHDPDFALLVHWHNDTYTLIGHTHALDNLSDVTITNPQDNDFLRYNGSQWVNEAVSAGSGGYSFFGAYCTMANYYARPYYVSPIYFTGSSVSEALVSVDWYATTIKGMRLTVTTWTVVGGATCDVVFRKNGEDTDIGVTGISGTGEYNDMADVSIANGDNINFVIRSSGTWTSGNFYFFIVFEAYG